MTNLVKLAEFSLRLRYLSENWVGPQKVFKFVPNQKSGSLEPYMQNKMT